MRAQIPAREGATLTAKRAIPGHAETCAAVDIGLLKAIQQRAVPVGLQADSNWDVLGGITLAPPGEYDRTVSVRWRCGLVSYYFYRLFMVALCNRETIYIFILFLLSSFFFLSFFPRLISAVGDWMFTILWHMVWP